MKKYILTFILITFSTTLFAQSFNQERTALESFFKRMYITKPFEGVKIVQDYENTYLLSAILITPSNSENANNRLASVKNNRQVSQYLGSLIMIDSETIIKTTENSKIKESVTEITEIIKENSMGYTKSMEILTIINLKSGERCYLFIRNIKDM